VEERNGGWVAHFSGTIAIVTNRRQVKMLFHHLPADVLLDVVISNNRNLRQETASNAFDRVEKICHVQRHRLSDLLQAGLEAMMK
jgi:hypothetical protein